MNLKEFRSQVLSSHEKERLENVKTTFAYPYINFHQTFVWITSIYEFLQQQVKWRSKYDNLPDKFIESQQHFQSILQSIIDSVQRNNVQWNRWNIESQISRTNNFPFIYNCPETTFLLQIYKWDSRYFRWAYESIIQWNNQINFHSREYFFWFVLAYEFFLKGKNNLSNRRDAEKRSMSALRNDFQKYLNESEKQLLDHLSNANNQFTDYVKKIDDLKNEKSDIFELWYNSATNDFDTFNNNAIAKIAELENVYRDKLKFEEPAKYREKRWNALKKQGNRLLLILVLLILLAVLSLYKLLRSTPEEIFEKMLSNRDKLSIIRWSIIYITLISFIAFWIKYVAKAMFSAYHLARDAEERYTLTYLYLSLLKDNNVTDNERNLVMQSLFSRAETWLLKEDWSPTMPYDKIIDRVIPK